MTVSRDIRHCSYCHRRVFEYRTPQVRSDPWCQATRDHRFPKFLCKATGQTDVTVLACRGCNMAKGTAPSEVFEYFIRQKPYYPPGNERKTEFEAFLFQLQIAGFRAAKRRAVADRPTGFIRDARGRFASRAAYLGMLIFAATPVAFFASVLLELRG